MLERLQQAGLITETGHVNTHWRKHLTPELHEALNAAMQRFEVTNLSELAWCLLNGAPQGCEACGERTAFRPTMGFKRFCSTRCSARSESTQQKRRETNKVVYGNEYPQRNLEQKEKAKETVLKRYGENPAYYYNGALFSSKMLELYGYKYPGQVPAFHEDRNKRVNAAFALRMTPLLQQQGLTIHGKLTSKKAVTLEHTCGYRFERRIWSCQIPRCPKCFPKKLSTLHLAVRGKLLEWGIKFKENDRTLIFPKELDFYLPEHQLAIEVNGLFWHSEAAGTYKGYHQWKTLRCHENEITLLHLYEDQLLLDFERTMNRVQDSYLNNNAPFDGNLTVPGDWPLPQRFPVELFEVLEPEQYKINPAFKPVVATPVWDAGKLIYRRK